MVGSLGKEAISSVSITQQPVYITLTFCFGLTAGIIAIVSRRFGQNDREGANKALRQTLVLGIIISSIITILSLVFGRAFIKLAGAKPDTIDNATAYFKNCFICFNIELFTNINSSWTTSGWLYQNDINH